MSALTSRQLILIATLASVASIIGAMIFESLGYAPCKLCYYQRYPHHAAIVIGSLALGLRMPALAWLGALAAATTSGIGFFHTGVERKWWPGPASCAGGDVSGMSAQDLLAQITAAPLVRCDEIPWRLSDMIPWDVLDLSMANFNAVGSLVLVFVWIAAARRA
jgi:disulfide bond formation protein DsbB